jgi:hypothetical protein
VFSVFYRSLEEKGSNYGNLGLKGQKIGKAEVSATAIECRRPAIERTSARAPKSRIERTCARAHKKRIAIERTRPTIKRTCA